MTIIKAEKDNTQEPEALYGDKIITRLSFKASNGRDVSW